MKLQLCVVHGRQELDFYLKYKEAEVWVSQFRGESAWFGRRQGSLHRRNTPQRGIWRMLKRNSPCVQNCKKSMDVAQTTWQATPTSSYGGWCAQKAVKGDWTGEVGKSKGLTSWSFWEQQLAFRQSRDMEVRFQWFALVTAWDMGERRRGWCLERSGVPPKELRWAGQRGGKGLNESLEEGRLSQKGKEERCHCLQQMWAWVALNGKFIKPLEM